MARTRPLELSIEYDEGLPTHVNGDPGRLNQVLTNLLSNAIKFTPSGRITLEVSLPEPTATDRLLFRVTDTGLGIREDRQASLFDSFTQVDTSTTRHYGGSGLGLAICRRLVDLMEGEIGVESVSGKGSTFWFSVNLPTATGVAVIRRVATVRPSRSRFACCLLKTIL